MDSELFVGRGPELAVLADLLAALARGVGGVVLLEGEQGIGKSALLRAGLAEARAAGCRVAWAAADVLGQRFPLRLIAECLRAGGLASGPGAEGGLGGRDDADGVLLPPLADGGGGDRPAGVAGFGGDRVLAGVERVLALVDRWCAVCPVVLVAEDLQWADEASVLVWDRLCAAVGQLPLLLAGSCRPGLEPGAELLGLRRDLLARGGTVLSLGPLAVGDVTALVAGVVGGRPGPGLAAMAGQAGGNPLYARELADALVRERRVRVAGGVAELAGEPGGVRVPESLAAAVGERLAWLGGDTVTVLRWAAVLGQEFSVSDLAVVTGRSAGELMEVVEAAVAGGVLAETGARLGFRHGLIWQVLYEGMPGSLRAALHLQAARALAGAGTAAERVAGQLMAAQPGAGEPEAAQRWVVEWLAGAAPGLVHQAPRVAAELLRRAVAGVAAADPRREVLAEYLAGVLFLLARYEQAEPVARGLVAQTDDPQRRARMAWTLAYTLLRTGRVTESLAVADQALRDGAGPAVWRARLRAVRAVVLVSAARYGEADSAAAQALADADRVGDRFAAGYALHVRSMARFSDRDYASFVEIVERALALIGDDPETTDLRLLLLINRLLGLSNLDREVDAEARQLLALAERAGTARIGMARAAVAGYLFDAGRWDDALAELEALFEPSADVIRIAVLLGRGLTALIAGHRDDRAGLAAHVHAAEDLPDLVSQRFFGVHLLRAQAVAAERGGRPGEAVAFLSAALAAGDPEGPVELHWLADLVRCALAAGDQPAAQAAAARCADEASRHGGSSMVTAAARRCRGVADTDPVPLAEAVAYYRTVVRPLELGQALEDLAVAQAADGDVAAARTALREAVQIYTGLGAQWDIRRAGARLRGYGIRPAWGAYRARPVSGWAALSPTEEKVARLVAAGLSNPDIAAELFLSRNTVQTHVSHILAKLGARSRAELTRELPQHPAARTPATA